MARKQTFRARLNKDRTIDRPESMYQEILEQFWHSEKDIDLEIIVKKVRSKASGQAHGYYRAVMLPNIVNGLIDAGHNIRKHSEDDRDVVHEFLKDKFLNDPEFSRTINIDGKEYRRTKTLEDIDVEDMSEFIEAVIVWSQEFLNITIPPPVNDYWKSLYKTDPKIF